MKVLITYASKMHGTEGIAEDIRGALVERGLSAEMVAVDDVRSLRGYEGVIVGSGLYANRWRRPARKFVKRNADALRAMPVWFFSSGPLDASATQNEIPPVSQVRALMAAVGARGHATFGGRLAPDATGFPASAMAKKSAGDWRDPEHIRLWAHGIADQLTAAARASTE